MKFLERRIEAEIDGKIQILTAAEFFSLANPKVLLADPGMGKSIVARSQESAEVKIVNAANIDAFTRSDLENYKSIILDGIDEVTSYRQNNFASLLREIPRDADITFTCRASEWNTAINANAINEVFGKRPIVGKLLPLTTAEIEKLIPILNPDVDPRTFLKEAETRGVMELIANPQNLKLLLQSVGSEWPQTKYELFETACEKLSNESNDHHKEIGTRQQNTADILDTAGFMFTQMLLSDNPVVSSNDDDKAISSKDLTSDDYPIDRIKEALSSNLFSYSGNGKYEPTHRTIAEFLAARFLSKELNNTLSYKRLCGLLYANNSVVPNALRNLHGWIATMTGNHEMMEKDAYGVFKYGDTTILSAPDAQFLIKCLEKEAEDDPFFRSYDLSKVFKNGLCRLALKDDFIRIISNKETSYQIRQLLIEAMHGEDFIAAVKPNLHSIVENKDATPVERHAAIEALLQDKNNVEWKRLVDSLKGFADVESMRCALYIVQENIELFSGKEIGELLHALTKAMNEGSRYAGIGYRLPEIMSAKQLRDATETLSKLYQDKHDSELWRHKFRFIKKILSEADSPDPVVFWGWIKDAERGGYYRSEWNEFSKQFFSENPEFRRAVQSEALSQASSVENHFRVLFSIADIQAGLHLRNEDFVFHMQSIVNFSNSLDDWEIYWKNLLQFALMHRDLSEEVTDFARTQIEQYPTLATHFEELTKPRPTPEWELEQKEYAKRAKEKRLAHFKSIRKNYEKLGDSLGNGKHLGAIGEFSQMCLARFSDADDTLPALERGKEFLGKKLYEQAISGVKACASQCKYTPREIAMLHAKDQKEYYTEHTLILYCHMELEANKSLEQVPDPIKKAALASCHWDRRYGDEALVSSVQEALEADLFSDEEVKRDFIKATIEPFLETGQSYISGLYRILNEEQFSDVMSDLCLQWLSDYPEMHESIYQELLQKAVVSSSREQLLKFLRKNQKTTAPEKRRHILMCQFLIDFDHAQPSLEKLTTSKDSIWDFRNITGPRNSKADNWPRLSAEQNYFIASNFLIDWPPTSHPSSGWNGDSNPWDAYNFIRSRLDALAADSSEEAETALRKLADLESKYQDQIKHSLAQQRRVRADELSASSTIKDVKAVLQQKQPESHKDLQAYLLDELEELEKQVRGSATDDVSIFWNDDATEPKDENTCRDRLTALLRSKLDKVSVNHYPEAAMPESNRADLLCSIGQVEVPIEAKGQWHEEIWTAATAQLGDYQKYYKADGYGIYLVFWFGDVEKQGKKARGHQAKRIKKPHSKEEMIKSLELAYPDLPDKTKIFVFDLSLPDKKRKKPKLK